MTEWVVAWRRKTAIGDAFIAATAPFCRRRLRLYSPSLVEAAVFPILMFPPESRKTIT